MLSQFIGLGDEWNIFVEYALKTIKNMMIKNESTAASLDKDCLLRRNWGQ